ncbi:MAG TPA: VOC family protein [Bacillales bacterium]|nr:VOC family protein [Bacillales bacterium]
MKKVIPHVTIENCKEAIEYYQGVFGGEIKNAKLADGIEMFKGHEGKYIHAELHINNDCVIYFVDIFGDAPVRGNDIVLSLDLESEEEINSIYEALSREGEATMELQDTFWGARYGKVTDRYGLHWELNYSKGQ